MNSSINNVKDINEKPHPENAELSFSGKGMMFVKSLFNSREKLKKMWVALASLILLVIIMIFNISSHSSNQSQYGVINKKSEFILRELSEMNNKLAVLSRSPTGYKEQKEVVQAIENNIINIQKSIIEVAKTSDVEKISSQLTSVKEDVDTQMGEIKKAISENMGNKQYLDAEALPFKVISVDVIAGRSYASVNYADHISPLGISDMLAGWRLLSADYDAGYAEFVNAKNQYVKVLLQG